MGRPMTQRLLAAGHVVHVYNRSRGAIDALAKDGATPADSAAQVVKLINQLLVGIHTSAIAEAAVFGARFGADPQIVLDLIGTSFGGSTMMTRNLPRFMSRDFSPATPVGLILKDLGLIHDEARNGGIPLLLGALAEQRFSEARARGMGDEDMAALVKLWE